MVVATFDNLKDLYIKKNQDYTGVSGNKFFNFDVARELMEKFQHDRDKVYVNMIGIKLGRLAALLNSGAVPNHESISDSFDDLIVYAAIWKADRITREEDDNGDV